MDGETLLLDDLPEQLARPATCSRLLALLWHALHNKYLYMHSLVLQYYENMDYCCVQGTALVTIKRHSATMKSLKHEIPIVIKRWIGWPKANSSSLAITKGRNCLIKTSKNLELVNAG